MMTYTNVQQLLFYTVSKNIITVLMSVRHRVKINK